MKIGLVGPTYQQSSLPFDAQRSINLYPVLDQTGKEVGSMYGTPGLTLFGNLGSAPTRGEFYSTNGRAFAISGSVVSEVFANGASLQRGTIDQSSGIVYIAENQLQLAIADGTSIYILTYATNTFIKVIGGLQYAANGDFASASGWTTGAGWSIGGGVATAATASSDLSRTSSYPIVSGKKYQLTYTVTLTAGTVTPKIGSVAGITRTAGGTFNEVIIAGATQDIAFTGAGFSGTLDNIAVVDEAFGLPASVGSITYIDSFFVINENRSGRFFKSQPNDGTKWDPLDFATAESSPDDLVRPIAAIGQLWLCGSLTTEIWTNTGAASFPFQKISGGKMNMGIIAPASVIELDNTIFGVGQNKEGSGIVFRANGFIPKRISTEAIELAISKATDKANIRSYAYQQEGHLFLVLTGGGLATSLVYDITTDFWHERAYKNSQGVFEQHLGCCYMNAFGKHIVGDRRNGNLYVMDSNVYSDNGETLSAVRVFTHLSDEAKRVRYNSLVIGVQPGTGIQNGQGSDPVIEMRLSTDGAETWSDIYTEPIGKVGKYKNKSEFRRLGVAEIMTFEIRINDPVKRAITGAYLK